MRPARQRNERRGRTASPYDSPPLRVRQAAANRNLADIGLIPAEPHAAKRRRVNGPGDRPAAVHERDIDGELAVSRDEFARSVERIDEQEPVGERRRRSRRHGLLGGHRRGMKGVVEIIADDRLCSLVGDSDRAAVALHADLAAVRIDLHDGGSGGNRRLRQEGGDSIRRCAVEVEGA